MPPTPWIPFELITAARLNAMVPVGTFEYFLPAVAWYPAWNPAYAGARCGPHERLVITPTYGEVVGLPFDPDITEVARTSIALPAGLTEAAAINVRLYWTNTVNVGGDVRWELWWGGYGGTAQTPTAGMGAMTVVTSGAAGSLVLVDGGQVAGHAPSPALGTNQQLWLQLARRATDATDTYPGDAYFLGVKLILAFDDTVDT